jgi:hypothetical protein
VLFIIILVIVGCWAMYNAAVDSSIASFGAGLVAFIWAAILLVLRAFRDVRRR